MRKKSTRPSLIALLFREAPLLLGGAVALGAAAGVLYSLTIPAILHQLDRPTSIGRLPGHPWIASYFAICAGILLCKGVSIVTVNNVAKSAAARLRIDLAAKINRMTIEAVERSGFAQLTTLLTEDVNHVSAAAVAIPTLLVSGVTVAGMLVYLAILSPPAFLCTLAAIAAGVCMFQLLSVFAARLYGRARTLRDAVQEGLRGLVMGAYELKLSPEKSRDFLARELASPERQSAHLEKSADAIIHFAGTGSELLSFFTIGMVVFVLPDYLPVDTKQNIGIAMALLYIAGPVAAIVGMMRHFELGSVALRRIAALLEQDEENIGDGACDATIADAGFGPLASYVMEQACYRYPAEAGAESEAFALAPTSLEFAPGQIHFIVGGNGSGKTTLCKLLSLHYLPAAGRVRMNGVPVDAANIRAARAHIAVIYSKYHLFGRLHRAPAPGDEERVAAHLASLGLDGKTRFADGCFSTVALSDGQRRRLALAVALMEDKDIYIFDEWAADQDPEFKRLFYENILPGLKRDRKLVIAITHDDRYFHCADRLIRMEDGKLIRVEEMRAAAAPLRKAAS